MKIFSWFLGPKSKLKEKATPEALAAGIFMSMVNNKKDIEMILQNFSLMNNQNIELELKFLKVFARIYLMGTTIKDENIRSVVFREFNSYFFSKSFEDYLGCPFETISERLDIRIHEYFNAVDEPNQYGTPYGIGKQFSRFIGYDDSANTTYLGSLFFTSELKYVGETLNNIMKQFNFD